MDAPPDIPDLTLLRRIGSGSYGDVWLARTVTGVYRAVKIVDRSRFVDERPFLRELKGITQFQRQVGDRPRQLALMHVGFDEKAGVLYYVMELADDVKSGTDIDPEAYEPLTLRAVHEQQPEMPARDCIRLGIELGRSVVELHAAGLIHRDIKISNVIFVAGVPKLADIGLVSSSDNSMTVLGTPGYTPAEGAVTTSADIYGLGKILYVLATGQSVSSFPRLPPDALERADAALLLELNEVVLRACDPEPARRYRSAAGMLDDLLVLQAGRSLKEIQRTRERLVALRRAAVVAAAFAAVIAAILGVQNHFNLRKLAEQESAGRLRAEEQEQNARYTSDLHRALVSLLNRDVGLARSALRRQIPADGQRDMRGPEWAALWNEAAGDDMRVYGKIGSPPIREAALSPDHRLLAAYAGERRGRVTIWNLETGEQHELAHAAQGLVGFNAEGSAVIVQTARGGLASYDFAGRASDETPPLPGQVIHSAARAGTILVTERLTADPVVGIWDLASRSQTATWKPDDPRGQKRLSNASISPVSDRIAVSTYLADDPTATYSLQVWSRASEWTRTMERPDFFHLQTIEFSPDASRLVVAGPANDLTLIDIATGKNVLEMQGHKGTVFDAAFSPDGRWLASAGEDQTIRVWSLADGACAAILRGHEGSVTTVAWLAPDLLVSTGTDGTARLWNREPPERARASRQFWKGFLGDFIYSPDSSAIFATMADGRIGEFNTHNLARAGRTWDALHPVALRDGVLWALTADLTLARCELETGAVVRTALHADRARRAIFTAASADARHILVGMGDGTVNIWEPASEKTIASSAKHSSAVFAAAFSPDSRFVVTGDTSGALWFWDPMTGEPIRGIQDDPSAVYCVAVSPGGHVAVGREDGNLSIFDARAGRLVTRALAHPQGVSALAYSPDGYRLFTCGYDGLVTAWSTPDYREVATLPIQPIDDMPAKPDPRPSLLHFAPDATRMIVFTEDGWLRAWDLRSPEE